jgi:hypothetical protein
MIGVAERWVGLISLRAACSKQLASGAGLDIMIMNIE